MTLELTKDEANQLVTLLDLAVKAGGLNVATVAIPLALKINAALQPVHQPTEVTP